MAPPTQATRIFRRLLADGLALDVHAHDLQVHGATVPAWTVLTDGLKKTLSRPELVVTVRRGDAPADAVPEALLTGLALIVEALRDESPLRPGMSIALSERAEPLLPNTELRALACFHARPIDGVPIVGGSLAAVLMRRDEHTAALDLGILRWAARRGERERVFPTPLWTDPTHPAMLHPDEAAASILGKIPRIYLVGASVTQYRDPATIVLDVEPVAAPALADLSRHCDQGFVLSGELSPLADACLVWRPGQSEPAAISDGDASEGKRMGGNFLLLGPTDSDGFRLLEDGFCVTLSAPAWARLQAALQSQEPIQIALPDATLVVRFLSAPPPQTVAGAEFPPLEIAHDHTGRLIAEVILLTLDSHSRRAATPAALSTFFLALEQVVIAQEREADRRGPAVAIGLDFRLDPEAPPAFRMQALGLADDGYLRALSTRLQSDLDLPTVLAPLVFRVVLQLPAA